MINKKKRFLLKIGALLSAVAFAFTCIMVKPKAAQIISGIYDAFNGNRCYLIRNSDNTIITSDIMQLSYDKRNITMNDLPTISDYLIENYDENNNDNNYYSLRFDLNIQTSIALYFTFNNTVLEVEITALNTYTGFNYTINNFNSGVGYYAAVLNTNNQPYNRLIYNGIYLPDYRYLNISLDIDGYSYQEGYTDGYNSAQSDIYNLQSRNDYLSSTNETLRQENARLQQELNDTLGWKPLFFTMADIPFKTVQNFLGFEVFGVDLFGAFVGLITILGIIWIFRKFK